MAEFNWDQFEEVTDKKTNPEDWDRLVMPSPNLKVNIPVDKEITPVEAAIRGGAQGMTMGMADEIAGAITGSPTGALKKALNYITPVRGSDDQIYPSTDEDIKKYTSERDIYRAGDKAAEEENPITYNVANLAGSFAIPMGTGVSAAKLGAMGALSGIGTSETDKPTNLALEAAGGAALGAGIGAVAPAIGKYATNKISKFTEEMADKMPRLQRFLTAMSTDKEVIGTRAADRIKQETKDVLRELESITNGHYSDKLNNILKKSYHEIEPTSNRVKGAVEHTIGRTEDNETAKILRDKLEKLANEFELNKYTSKHELLGAPERVLATGKVISEVPEKLLQSRSRVRQILGQTLKAIGTDPTGEKKRAALFSISQQPAFRDLLKPEEFEE